MLSPQKYAIYFLLAVSTLVFPGCASHEVRHLASEASLISPGKTSQQEILGLLGPPDQKLALAQGGEQWRYYQGNKSFWRRTPYFGSHLGEEDFDVLTITLRNQRVVDCVYRQLNEKEFDKLGIDTGAPAK
jgi:hypothetical protein